jgi:putative membrane protein
MGLNNLAFDTTYISGQVSDHQKAIALFQTEINNCQDARVKAYANKYLPKLQMHLMRLQS